MGPGVAVDPDSRSRDFEQRLCVRRECFPSMASDDNRENEHTSPNSQKCGMKHVIGYFALHSSHFLSASAGDLEHIDLLWFSSLRLQLGNPVVQYSMHITDSGDLYKLRGAKV